MLSLLFFKAHFLSFGLNLLFGFRFSIRINNSWLGTYVASAFRALTTLAALVGTTGACIGASSAAWPGLTATRLRALGTRVGDPAAAFGIGASKFPNKDSEEDGPAETSTEDAMGCSNIEDKLKVEPRGVEAVCAGAGVATCADGVEICEDNFCGTGAVVEVDTPKTDWVGVGVDKPVVGSSTSGRDCCSTGAIVGSFGGSVGKETGSGIDE